MFIFDSPKIYKIYKKHEYQAGVVELTACLGAHKIRDIRQTSDRHHTHSGVYRVAPRSQPKNRY